MKKSSRERSHEFAISLFATFAKKLPMPGVVITPGYKTHAPKKKI